MFLVCETNMNENQKCAMQQQIKGLNQFNFSKQKIKGLQSRKRLRYRNTMWSSTAESKIE